MTGILNSPNVSKLKTLIEEEARSTPEGVKRFVEPMHGALDRALIKRHQIVFGRRGSGKSSLLRKAASNLTVDRRPIAYVDLESFKGLSYPDVLLSILIQTFSEFEQWLLTAAVNPATKTSFWQKRFGSSPNRSAYNRKQAKEIADRLHKQQEILTKQLHSAENMAVQLTSNSSSASGFQSQVAVRAGATGIGASLGSDSHSMERHEEEVKEQFARSKVDFIHRNILEYQRLFRKMAELSGGDSYLFLDDLYYIRQVEQVKVLDYFHRLAKGNNLWLKVGTIRHRTHWYIDGDPPIGVKLGDDADAIDLDLTLEKFSLAKRFLIRILSGFMDDCGGIALDQLLVDDAVNRLILASGGVARDFLGIFRRSIDFARERGSDHRGERVGIEDVNRAAGEYDTSKREEFKQDTLGERTELEVELENIQNFCFNKANANIFLLDQDTGSEHVHAINELVDLRLLHRVRSRITVWDREGKLYEAYMLDVSQYTGSRAKRNLDIIEFWKQRDTDNDKTPRRDDRMRRAGLIYNPTTVYPSSDETTARNSSPVSKTPEFGVEQKKLLD